MIFRRLSSLTCINKPPSIYPIESSDGWKCWRQTDGSDRSSKDLICLPWWCVPYRCLLQRWSCWSAARVQVDLTLNITERKTGGLSGGVGISAQGHAEGAVPGFIGSCSYSQRNLFGLNQKLTATVELGQVRPAAALEHAPEPRSARATSF